MPVAHVPSQDVALREDEEEGITVDDLPDELTVSVGEEAQLRLPSLAAAGYRWESAADDPQVVETSVTFEEASSAAGSRRRLARMNCSSCVVALQAVHGCTACNGAAGSTPKRP